MIDTTNFKPLTPEMRRLIARRALFTQPYFFKFDFPIITSASKSNEYEATIGINRDFVLTEVMGNFGEAFTATGSLFDVALYSGYLNSIYKFEATKKLPSGFMFQEARFRTPTSASKFDDRQAELMPVVIPNGDIIYCQIRNTSAKAEDFDVVTLLKGFSRLNNVYVQPREQERINKSLEKPENYQFFKFNVNHNGKQTYLFENDATPRLILSFGATNTTIDKTAVSQSTVSITDNTRRLSWNNKPLPIQFIAPRLMCLLDTNKYFLPVEYYCPPFTQISFEIENLYTEDSKQGYSFNILTRTI